MVLAQLLSLQFLSMRDLLITMVVLLVKVKE